MTYKEQLLQPQWLEKREAIKKRDGFECQLCLSTARLHVHHKAYIAGNMAWEYDDKYLITLCGKCHQIFHNEQPIQKVFKSNRTPPKLVIFFTKEELDTYREKRRRFKLAPFHKKKPKSIK